MRRSLAVLVVVAACRYDFQEVPDAGGDAAVSAALPCNTPVRIGAGAATAPRLSAASTRTAIVAAWIDDAGELVRGGAQLTAPDTALPVPSAVLTGDMYTDVSLAATPDVVLVAFSTTTGAGVRLYDPATNMLIAGPTSTPIQTRGPHAAAPTGNPTGAVFAIVGNDMVTTKSELAGVTADASLLATLDSGSPNGRSTLVNVGDRLAIVDVLPGDVCEVKTADLAVTSRVGAVTWGASGQCTQATLGYAPGQSDALLVRHDRIDGDLNHVVASRSALKYTIPPESRLRNPGNEARPIGTATGYWVTYETGGTLEAVQVSFAGFLGRVVPLGPLASASAHDLVVHDGEPYAIWLQDGLELAHLCP